MKKRIELKVENRLPPLPEDTIQRLCSMGTGPVSDACPEALAIGSNLYPIGDYGCVAGRALPVDAGPRDNLTAWASLRYARSGDVLFVSTQACTEISVCGDLLVGFARNAGIAALVTDGCIRDLNGILETRLPVYAAGTSPKAPAKAGPGKIGHPVNLAGTRIERDMVAVCDRDGIVVFDSKHLESTLHNLQAIEAKETAAAKDIEEGRRLPARIETMLEQVDFGQ